MMEVSVQGKLFKAGVVVGMTMSKDGLVDSPVIRSGGKYYAMDYFSPSYDTCMAYVRGHTGVDLFHSGAGDFWAVSVTDGRNILKVCYGQLGLNMRYIAKGKSKSLHNLTVETSVTWENWKIR